MAVLALSCSTLPGRPFKAVTFEAAAAQAKAEDKLLLIDFTTRSHQVGRLMEIVAWRDEQVCEWLTEHAVAIQVDAETHRELAERFDLNGLLRVILLRDGVELDRHPDFSSARATVASLGFQGLFLPSESIAKHRCEQVARIHAVTAAAGRREQAAQVAKLLLADDSSGLGRMALVEAALHLDTPLPEETFQWLREAEQLGADVRPVRNRLAGLPSPVPRKDAPAADGSSARR